MRNFRGLWELKLVVDTFFILYSLVKQATTGPVVRLDMLQSLAKNMKYRMRIIFYVLTFPPLMTKKHAPSENMFIRVE